MRPIQLAFLLFIVCRIFLSSLTLWNTSSFFTRSVKMIFSFLIQYHISKLSIYFWSNFRKCPISSTFTMLHSKCGTLLVSSSNLSPICWWKVFLLKAACAIATSTYKILERSFKRRQISTAICVNGSKILKETASDVVHVFQDKAQWPAVV